MPPPPRGAELSEIVPPVTVIVPEFQMPPPWIVELSEIAQSVTVTVPVL